MASTVQPSIVAVTDAHRDTCGAVTWWKLSGEIELHGLSLAWSNAGLDADLLPPEPSPAKRIRRAVDKVARGMPGRHLVRPLAGQMSWAIVDETATQKDLDYKVVLRARIDGELLDIETQNVEGGALLRVAYDHYGIHLTSNDISRWLLRTMDRMKAVGLRQGGGIYFVPQGRVAELRELAEILGGVSGHAVYEVPALKSEEAVRAILHAVLDEADQELGYIEGEVAERDLGKKALKTREKRCETLLSKVGEYEQLLGKNMDGLRERTEGLKANIVAAVFAANEEGDKACQPKG